MRLCAMVSDLDRCVLPDIEFCRSRNVGLSQNDGDVVGALDYGGDNHDARDCSRSSTFRGGATWACGVFGKMPRRRQGMRQPLYVEISDQGRRAEGLAKTGRKAHERQHGLGPLAATDSEDLYGVPKARE
jgi:hypothetical protein